MSVVDIPNAGHRQPFEAPDGRGLSSGSGDGARSDEGTVRGVGVRARAGKPTTLGVTEMSCSDVSHRVLNEPLSSDEIAQNADLFTFPMRAGYPIHCPERTAVDGTWTATAVTTV
jgi:hypothetical protein